MKKTATCLFVATLIVSALQAQTIETPPNTPLSLNGDINLPNNKAIQAGGVTFIRLPPAEGTNVSVGFGAGANNASGTQNVFMGYKAGFNTNSSANLMLGHQAGMNNTSGTFNSFIGVQAGQANTTGSSNYFFGTNSGGSNTTGSGNYFLGDNTGGSNTSGGFNIYIGANAGNGAGVNGSNNTAIGFESGRGNNSGVTNTFIGFRADASAASLSNATALGADAKVSQSNSVVLGNNANVGIGTTAPQTKLHIVTGIANTSGVRLNDLTNTSPASALNQTKFLTVDASGNVVLGSLNGSARLGAGEPDVLWQQKGQHVLNTNEGGIVIGSGIDNLPSGYSLYVSKGILTEKVKVAVKHTSEWSDKVFSRGYPLRSLRTVGQYIQAHQHLPGLPSAEETVSEGLDVARMDAKLLEKIEELTLYVLQQQQQLQRQQGQIQRLRQQMQQRLRTK